MTAIVGLDPSLTATGLALDGITWTVTSKPTGDLVTDRMARIIRITNEILVRVPTGSVVVMEGPAYASNQAGQHHLRAGLWWHLAIELTARSCCIVEAPPSTLKKFATGKGNASKGDMRMALYKRATLDLGDDNQVDAYWLRQIGLHLTGQPDAIDLPQTHLAALDKIHAQLPAVI